MKKFRLENDAVYRSAEDYFERLDHQFDALAQEFKSRKSKLVKWPVIQAQKLTSLWLTFGRRGGFSEDEREQLLDVREGILDLIARLYASTVISGHTPECGRKRLEECGHEFTDPGWEQLLDFLNDSEGRYILSDYGFPLLHTLYSDLFLAITNADIVFYIDRVLNVVHQRSDLAALFVQGGSKTLQQIAEQGGYVAK